MAPLSKKDTPPQWVLERIGDSKDSALPDDILLQFRVISRTRNPVNNYRWALSVSGAVFYAAHSGDADANPNPSLPADANFFLPPEKIEEIRKQLGKYRFAEQPAYQGNPDTKGGAIYVITVFEGSKAKEAVYEAYTPPLVEWLQDLSSEYFQK